VGQWDSRLEDDQEGKHSHFPVNWNSLAEVIS
jgi:hypothetical protein